MTDCILPFYQLLLYFLLGNLLIRLKRTFIRFHVFYFDILITSWWIWLLTLLEDRLSLLSSDYSKVNSSIFLRVKILLLLAFGTEINVHITRSTFESWCHWNISLMMKILNYLFILILDCTYGLKFQQKLKDE